MIKKVVLLATMVGCTNSLVAGSPYKNYNKGEMRDGIFYCDTTSLPVWLQQQVALILFTDLKANLEDVIFRLQLNNQRFILSYRGSETPQLTIRDFGWFFGDSGAIECFDTAIKTAYASVKARQRFQCAAIELTTSAGKEVCLIQ